MTNVDVIDAGVEARSADIGIADTRSTDTVIVDVRSVDAKILEREGRKDVEIARVLREEKTFSLS